MYIEASAPRKTSDRAKLISQIYPAGGAQCLQFYYHMYGAGMGTMLVFLHSVDAPHGDQGSMVISRTGNQGNSWLLAQANINMNTPYQVLFIISISEECTVFFPHKNNDN